ncbi:MAG: hypothetical protein J6O13_11230 [Selenomonas sp.]|nr:hypothetical protein [Selenomonas sp.]
MTEKELIYNLRNMLKFLAGDDMARAEVASKVSRACNEVLAPPQQKIVDLVYIGGLSPTTVASVFDMPLRRVELLRRSALRFLLAALA